MRSSDRHPRRPAVPEEIALPPANRTSLIHAAAVHTAASHLRDFPDSPALAEAPLVHPELTDAEAARAELIARALISGLAAKLDALAAHKLTLVDL